MTPWGLRKRLRIWLFDKLVGEMLNADVEAEPPPAPPGESVELMPDGAPMLSPEAQQMIVDPRAPGNKPIPAAEPPPLTGSVEERLARLKLR